MSKGKREAVKGRAKSEGTKGDKARGGRSGLIALTCAAALALLIFGVCRTFFVSPDVGGDPSDPGPEQTVSGGDKQEDPKEEGDKVPEKTKTRKEDYYTFLLVGKDTSSGSTDTIILVSYDVPNGQVNLMSIPRDTVVNVPWAVKKINSVYSSSEASGGGIGNLKKHVSELTGVMPDFYAVIEWKAVGRIVDAVGGVDFYVPRNMNYDDPYQDLHIHLTKGQQHLTGEQAMAMLRYRTDNDKSVGYGEPGRTETQRDFLMAMAAEVLQLGNITRVGKFVEIFMENVKTDMKLTDLMWFASRALGVDLSTMNSSTMPYLDVGIYRGGYYFMADAEGILPLVNEQFNPYEEEMTLEDLAIVQRGEDGACYVTGGQLLDENWAQPYSGSLREEAGGGEETVLVGSNVSGGSPAQSVPEDGSEEEPEEEPEEGTEEEPEEESGTGTDPDTGTEPGEEQESESPQEGEEGQQPEGSGGVPEAPDAGDGTGEGEAQQPTAEEQPARPDGEGADEPGDGSGEMPDWLS